MKVRSQNRAHLLQWTLVGLLLSLLPSVAFAQWSNPDPLVQARPGARIEEYVRLAVLEPGKDTDRWLARVKAQMNAPGCASHPGAERPLCAIVAALGEYGVFYHGAPGLRPNQADDMTANLSGPSALLRSRKGECRQSSLLAAATLKALGYTPVFVVTQYHVVPALLLRSPSKPPAHAILLPSQAGQSQTTYLVPIEATVSLPESHDPARALLEGHQFVVQALDSRGTIVADLQGKVLFRNQTRSALLIGQTDLLPLSF